MHSTKFLFGVVVLALAFAPAQSYARPTPVPVPVNPDPKPKAIRFPMPSAEFRPFFDKLMTAWEQAAAQSAAKGKPAPSGWAARIRFAASQAMEDGWVTEREMQTIMNAGE